MRDRPEITLDHRGIEEILKSSDMHRAVQAATEEVADNVRSLGIGVGDRTGGASEIPLPVKVEMTTTDRARGSVILAHPAGLAVQAKHGALTRAASEAGLEVRG